MKWKQSAPILVIVTLAACGASAQQVTFSGKLEEQIHCNVSSASSAQWNEEFDSGNDDIPLFSLANGQVEVLKPQLSKYDDFSATLESDIFIMTIRTVEKDDGGSYVCVRIGRAGNMRVELEVEALPDSFDLTCFPSSSRKCGGPDETLASSVDCRCTATEVSPSSLQLQWSISPSHVIQNETQDAGDYFDLISEVTIAPTSTEEHVTCSLTGYQSEGIDNSLKMRTYNFVTPVCTLELISFDDMCTTAELNCDCSGGMPDAYTYSFFYGNKSRISDSETSNIAVDIVAEEAFTFYCRGCNGIYGEKSLAEKADIVCIPGTTAIPTTTTEPTTTVTTPIVTISNPTTDNVTTTEPSATTDKTGSDGTGDGGGGNTAAIVVGVVGGCVGVAVIVIIIIVILKKRENGVEGKSNTAATTNSAAPVYGVVNKSTKKKSDNTDGNGVNAKLAASQPETTEPAEYASVKPKSQPQAAPRSSAPPEKMELQYADLDHGNRGPSNEVRQPTNEPTEYATVQSVIV